MDIYQAILICHNRMQQNYYR